VVEFGGAVVVRVFRKNCTLLELANLISFGKLPGGHFSLFCHGHSCLLHASQYHNGRLGRTRAGALDGFSVSGRFCRTSLCLLPGQSSMNASGILGDPAQLRGAECESLEEGIKRGRFIYVGNAALSPPPDTGIGTPPGPRWLAQ
jgi:hypothetical protein